MQASAVQHAVNDLVSEVSASVAVAQAGPAQDIAMDVDIQAQRNEHNAKRKAEDELAPGDAKKVHVGEPFSPFNVVAPSLIYWAEAKSVPLKRYSSHSGFILCGLSPLLRDRENCTVFVADLPTATTEDDLRALFKDVRRYFT